MIEQDTKLYTIAQIRSFEADAIKKHNIPESELMYRAASAALLMIEQNFHGATKLFIVCGKGNNGGDGYVLAQIAHRERFNVRVRYVEPPEESKATAREVFELCQKIDIDMKPYNKDEKVEDEIIVDALLGIGIKNPVNDKYRDVICALNKLPNPILSIDVPSGIDADTGVVLGAAIHAMMTLTFIGLKQGLFTGEALSFCGKVILNDLDIPKDITQKTTPSAELSPKHLIQTLLPPRKKNVHKRDFGHVFIVGGDFGMAGAPRLAAQAALRVGAGLVTVITRPAHCISIIAQYPEIMAIGFNESDDLLKYLDKASVVIVGPGLGQSAWSKNLLHLILNTPLPKVIDADAIHLLEDNIKKEDWVLTPHPGEAAALLKKTTQYIQQNRFAACEEIVAKFGGCCVLKGAGTLTKYQNDIIKVCSYGNPGMASAGMGDALSGIIGGLIAQKIPVSAAGELGVLIHALAGDAAAKKGERGLLASDLIGEVRGVVNER